ncbi:MAG: hypothetical protein ABL934_18015 [Lysobacteraceae bacterium]
MSIYLKKSIAAIVMAMSLGYATDSFANNSSTGPDVFDEMQIVGWDNPYDVSNEAFDWTIADYDAWDVGTSEESGGGGSYSPPPAPSLCDELRDRKPDSCPNPIPFPNGYGYGRDAYPSGSGIPRLLYWIEHVGGVDSAAREWARSGLSLHTIDITQTFISIDRANERLLLSVQSACRMQSEADQQNPLLVDMSHMQRNCLEVLERLQAEAGDQGFRSYFFDWLEREGLHLDDLGIPETMLDWLAPSNSLRIRYDTISTDAKCAKWWIDAQANQCIF